VEVRGSQKVAHVEPKDLYVRMMDPESLRHATPGLKNLDRMGENRYHVVVEMGVAAVKGRFEGTFELADAQPGEGFTLRMDMQGPTGFVKADVPIRLRAEGDGSVIEYAGEAQVGGTVAGVGQRVLGGVAKWIVGQFFSSLAKEASSTEGASS